MAKELLEVKDWLRRGLPVWVTVVTAAVLITSVCLGYRFITSSDRFAIRSIDVRGNVAVSAERVAAILGIEPGDNIFAAKLDEMARTLERDPWVAEAEVRRGLPDALIVELVEHRPAALVELGGLYLADERGQVFKRAAIERGEGSAPGMGGSAAPGHELPVITGLSREDYVEHPGDVQLAVREVLAAVALYQEPGGRPAVGEAHVDPRHGITLLTHENAVALRLGRGDHDSLQARLHVFDLVWKSLSSDERLRVRAIFADDISRSERVTVAFGE